MWTKENEEHKLQTIKMLEKMLDSLKSGNDLPIEINIEWLTDDPAVASEFPGSVIGKKITLIYRECQNPKRN